MSDMKSRNSRSQHAAARTDVLQQRYDEDYFSGKSSGYDRCGYANDHPDWQAWLDLISMIQPSGVLIDLGCAYGYLPREARKRGFQAFGCDISGYALRQEKDLRHFLVQSDLHSLPFPDACSDVVALFDVLEHLEAPLQCLSEASRLLKPEGLLIGATPDPIFFERKEPTHCFERPPSFWLAALRTLGFEVVFRFSNLPYNFQFVASRPGTEIARRLACFQHDYFSLDPDFASVRGELTVVPRSGWGPLKEKSRKMEAATTSLYLCNCSRQPVEVTLSLWIRHTPDFATLRIRFNSLVLERLHLDSEQTEHDVRVTPFMVPGGGHHLFFDVSPEGPEVFVSEVDFETRPVPSKSLAEGLPFDLYQRYQLSAQITDILNPASVLDVGGVLGDRYGHLAASFDFFGSSPETSESRRVISSDLRQCDHPDHVPCNAWGQPFPDSAFDLVVSLDVLEHLTADKRSIFFAELDRLSSRWIVIGAPFFDFEVEKIERELVQVLDLTFLEEHRRMGLPKTSDVLEFFKSGCGYQVEVVPSGFLPRWKEMQLFTQLFFSLEDCRATQEFNRSYNRTCFSFDQAEPSYRRIFLISKSPLEPKQLSAIQGLHSSETGPASISCQEMRAAAPEFSAVIGRAMRLLRTREKAFHDVQFLINHRQKHIELLQRDALQTPLWKLILRRLRRILKG